MNIAVAVKVVPDDQDIAVAAASMALRSYSLTTWWALE